VTITGTVIAPTVTFTNTSGNNYSIGGAGGIGGMTSLLKQGTGLVTITAPMTYSGTTSVTSGTLAISGSGTLGGGAAPLAMGGGTVDLGGGTAKVGAVTITASGSNIIQNGNLTATSYAGTNTTGTALVTANLLGVAATLSKSGAGTLTLSGSNSYTGVTTVSAGTLQFAKTTTLYGGVTSSWIASNLVVNNGYTAAFNVGGTGEFAASDIAALAALGNAGNGFRSGAIIGLDTTNAAGGVFTYGSVLANPNGGANTLGLTKLGSNTLTLTASNSYTGGTTVTGGTLNLANPNATGTGGTVTLSGGAISFDSSVAGNAFTFGSLAAAASTSTLALQNSAGVPVALTVGGNNAAFITYAGVLSGSGSVTKTGTTAWTLSSNASTFSGGLTVLTGQLTIGVGVGGSTLGSGTLILGDSTGVSTTPVTLSSGENYTYSNPIAVVGVNQVNTIVDTGRTGSFSGLITFSNASLILNDACGAAQTFSGGISGTGNLIVISSGSGGSVTLSGTVNNTGTITNSGTGYTPTAISAVIGSNVTGVAQSSTNCKLTLSGSNSYGGGTTLSSGTLNYSNGYALGTGTATFTGNATLQAGVTGTVANNIAIASGMTGTFDNQTYAATLSGIVSGSGALTKIGTGALVLIAANSYTGATTVSTGTLQLGDGTGGHDGSLATSAITNSGALIYNLSGSQTAGYLISGTGSLTKSGMGSLFLTASNSYTGATTVSAGMLSVSATNNLGAAAANLVLSGGTLQITGTTLTNFSGIGHTVSFTAAQPVALDIANAANTFTADQSLNQTTGGLTKSGSGTLILSASNSYTGATTVTGGTLQIGNGTTGSLATSSTVTVNAGATLAVNLANSGTFSSPIYTGLGGSAVNSMSSGTTTFSNNIYSGGSFNQTGAGTTILLGNNVSFYGPTNITAGVLQLSGSYAASITTVNVGVDNGLSFGVNAITIGGLSGTGAVALLNGTNGVALTVGNNNQDSTYSGAISGTNSGASFIKSGSGTLTLTGSSTYTVPTTISSGTLQLGDGTSGHDGALSTSAVTDNGTLGYNLSGSQTPSYLISGSGGLTKSGSGTLILTGSNTFTGVTLVNAGTLLLSATAGTTSYGIGKSTFDTSGAGTLSFGGMTAATFGGLQGAGNLVLSNTAGAAVALTVGANNQNTLYSGTLSGPGSLTKSGSGSLTMAAPYTLSILALDGAGSLAFQNNVTVSNLTLQNTSGVNTTTGAITVAAGKTLTIGGPSVSAPLTVASGSIAGVTNTVSISGATVGTGALAVTGTSMTLGNSYAITSDEYDTLNLSGLGSFTANVTNLQVGYLSNSSASRSSRGSLILAATNTITATTLSVGCATGSYNPSAVGLLELGSVNTFNVGTLNIGTGSKPASLLMFNPALGSPGTLVLRGTAGGSTTTTMAIDAANWTSSASYHQQADFTGGILDAKFGNVTVGSDLGNQNTHSSCLAIGQTTGAGADFSGGLLTIGQWAGSSYGSNVYDTMIPASFYIGTSSGSATMTSGTIKLANNTSASNVTVGPTVSGTVNPLPGTFVSGILTVGQNASVTASSIMLGLSGTGIASTNATVNLNNGGALTIQAGGIYTAQYAGASPATSTLSFDGGTLRASSSGSLVGSGSGALTSVTVLSGGATIDSNGNNVSIDQPLSAGVGNGLSSIAVTGSGSSWATAPYVQITDATGTGASAFAKIDGAGHVTSIFVTNRGQNYTSPTITLLSGGGNGVTLSSTMAPVTGGGLTKTGAGTLTLSASNGYTGATAINAGTLNLANANALAGGGNLTFGGGTLQYSATNQADYSARIANSGSAISIDTNGQTVSFASSLASSNTGGLTKLGAGTLALSAANNYRGGTTVTSGSLQIGNANALGTGGLTVNGGTFDLAGNSVSVPAFSGAGGNVTNSVSGTSTLTANTSGTATYNGNIADGAGSVVLTNSGAGTLILGGSLTMTGLNASNGVTQLTQSGSIGAVNVAAGATLSMAANSSGIRNVLSISSLTISGFTSTLASANNAAVNSAAYTSVASSAQSPNAGVLTDTGVSLTQAAAATATAPASPEAVPEPGTLGLLMAGAISLLRRRAGKKTL